jgi:peptidase E
MHILACGGGGFGWAGRLTPLERAALDLTGASVPRVCYVPTASGDNAGGVTLFYETFPAPSFVPSHLTLFAQPSVPDVAAHLAGQDLVWVGGGSSANLLAVWEVHGVGEAMRAAWRAGTVLAGVSAGSICWFRGGPTDSYGPDLRPLTTGLGLIDASHCPHYDSETRRRPTYHALVGDGTLPAGWAADDGVGLHFEGTSLAGAVADRPDASAYRVERAPDGSVTEERITPRTLSW